MDNNAICAGMLAQIHSLVTWFSIFIKSKFSFCAAVCVRTTLSSKQQAKQKFSLFCWEMKRNLYEIVFGLHDTCNCFILVGRGDTGHRQTQGWHTAVAAAAVCHPYVCAVHWSRVFVTWWWGSGDSSVYSFSTTDSTKCAAASTNQTPFSWSKSESLAKLNQTKTGTTYNYFHYRLVW